MQAAHYVRFLPTLEGKLLTAHFSFLDKIHKNSLSLRHASNTNWLKWFFASGAMVSILADKIGDDAFLEISVAGGIGGEISADVSYMRGSYYGSGEPTKKSFKGLLVK